MLFRTPTVTDERDALAVFASQQIHQVATTLQGVDGRTPTSSMPWRTGTRGLRRADRRGGAGARRRRCEGPAIR
jgi:hypothetical protein